jgi:hypothetical protein
MAETNKLKKENVMQISNNISSSQLTSISNSQPPEPSSTGSQPPSHEEAVSQLGASLSEDQQATILSGIEAMQEDGATDEEIKEFVDSSLEDYGIDLATAKGTLTNTVA